MFVESVDIQIYFQKKKMRSYFEHDSNYIQIAEMNETIIEQTEIIIC